MQSNHEVLASLPTTTALAGRTALVTGSTSGIGEAIARVLAASGAHVVISGRDQARADQVVKAITELGGQASSALVDLSATPSELRAFAHNAEKAAGGRIDILVNNAAIYPVGSTEGTADADIDALLAVNVRAPHVLVGALAPAMAERGDGAIVNIGSWMARMGSPFGAMYTATKAAVEQLTRAWSAEYGQRGVRVNTVAPGITATPGNSAFQEMLESQTKQWTPAGAPVRPVDIAFAVRYLAGPEGAFLHASRIDVDGGVNLTRVA